MSRVKYKKTCVDCGNKEVKQEDIVKGYEYEKDKYVIFEESDFEKLKTEKEKSITIQQFVDIEQIDPVYYDKAYYVIPTGAEKAYSLLVKAMDDSGKVGIAKTVLGTKETLIAVRVKNGYMYLNTLYYNEEIQKNQAKETLSDLNVKELNIAKSIINAMSSDFKPEEYHDEYREKLQQAIETKIAGKEIIAPEEEKINDAANLMEALEMTLTQLKTTEPKSKTKPKPKSKAKAQKAI